MRHGKKHGGAVLLTALTVLLAWSSAVLAGPDLENELRGFIGGRQDWGFAGLPKLRWGMDCAQVRALCPGMPPCPEDIGAKAAARILVPRHDGLVSSQVFKFRHGRLAGITVNFSHALDREDFRRVTDRIFSYKWGLPLSGPRGEVLTVLNPDGRTAQRAWIYDHWVIEVEAPAPASGAAAVAGVLPAYQPSR